MNLNECVERYLRDCVQRSLGVKTIARYRQILDGFAEFAKSREIGDASDVKPSHALDYINSQRHLRLERSRWSMANTIYCFLKWCSQQGCTDCSEAKCVVSVTCPSQADVEVELNGTSSQKVVVRVRPQSAVRVGNVLGAAYYCRNSGQSVRLKK